MESGKVIVGKYRLNQLLGSGGMAEVWSATNLFTERQLAIKFMQREVAKTPEAAARFLNEAKVSARINHPNVIEIHDVGQTEEGQLFLVMELLTGIPLEVALRRQNPPMTVYEFALVMVEVGDALAAAHRSGIVHRDLKPTNVFLHKVREGVAIPKLLDFGVSKFIEEDHNHGLTIAGTVLGSPLYMSPEQARGDSHLDGRTDVFAFGAILFEALCGQRPYEARNFNALIVKVATTKPKSIDEHAPTIPESLRAIVRGCLEPDIAQRLQTFEEVTRRLRAALPELESSTQRLPGPVIPSNVVDPDATNALPVMRASERMRASVTAVYPPKDAASSQRGASGSGRSLSASASVPPGSIGTYLPSSPTGPSWHTPNTSYASTKALPPRQRGMTYIVLGAVAVIAVSLAAGVGLGLRSRSARATASDALAPTAQGAEPAPGAGGATTGTPPSAPHEGAHVGEPPTVSIDSLPGAMKQLGPVPRGSGRILVTAAPGWCTLSVDGKERGPTPVAGIDLPAGAHQLRCEAPNGRATSTTITVQEGATSRIKLPLDE